MNTSIGKSCIQTRAGIQFRLLKATIIAGILLACINVHAQTNYTRPGCERTVYPMIELSGEAGATPGFNLAFGLTSHEFPVSAHLLLNFVPNEAGKGNPNSSGDMSVNPMLMLRMPLIHSEEFRHHVELMAAGGTNAYRAGFRYAYSFAGQGSIFVQPALSNKGYVTGFGVNVAF